MPFPSRVARTGIEPATQGFSVLKRFVQMVIGNHKSHEEKGALKDKIWELKFNDGRRIYYAYIPEKTFCSYQEEIKMDKTKTCIKQKSLYRENKDLPKGLETV